jgi:protein-tyrosine-phosphatase
MRILFVCDGNICRSPLAAAYFRQRAASAGLSHVVVDSAGLLGIEGAPAAPFSIEVARDAGLDLTRHRSRGVTREDAHTADLVLGMTRAHLDTLARRLPSARQRRLMLRAFEHGPMPNAPAKELSDPVSGPIEEYREAFAIIRTCVDHLVLHLGHST